MTKVVMDERAKLLAEHEAALPPKDRRLFRRILKKVKLANDPARSKEAAKISLGYHPRAGRVSSRIGLIAEALSLPGNEIPDATDDGALIDFARRHGQSLDWIFCGDVRGMIHHMAERRHEAISEGQS